jgi:hypothetical protein
MLDKELKQKNNLNTMANGSLQPTLTSALRISAEPDRVRKFTNPVKVPHGAADGKGEEKRLRPCQRG